MKKIHHDIEFTVLRKKLKNTGNIEEKIALLERLVSLQPRNPRNLALRRRYRDEMETLRLKKASKKRVVMSPYDGIHYKRQVAIIGVANTGKSTLLNRLAGGDAEVKDSPYTTHKPEVQMMNYHGVSIQAIEVPALFPGDTDTAKYRFIRNADVVCLCVKTGKDYDSAVRQLAENSVLMVNEPLSVEKIKNTSSEDIIEKPAVVAGWKPDTEVENLTVVDINDIGSVSKCIFELFNLQSIYLLLNGEVQEKPQVFPAEQEVTVYDFINSLDKRLLKRFKRVKISHNDASIPDVQSAGLEYKLADGDTVEIISS